MADIIPINLPSLPRLVIQRPGGIIEPLGPNNYAEAFDLDDGFADWLAQNLDDLFETEEEGEEEDDLDLGEIEEDDDEDDDEDDVITTSAGPLSA